MSAKRGVSLLILLSLAALSLEGQITGEIKGIVTDQSGAAVPSVRVLVTSIETGEGRSVSTDQEGRFGFPLLKIGDYTSRCGGPRVPPGGCLGVGAQRRDLFLEPET